MGFQHVQLARNLDILVTPVGEITKGRVLPFGRLREARSAAARAAFVVVMDADLETARAEAWELGISQFAAARRTLDAAGAIAATHASDAADALVAVAGIGRPAQFFEMLRDAEFSPSPATMSFPDHHRYTLNDVTRIAAAARAAGAGTVVTTAKDAVRFEPLAPLPFVLRPVPMVLDVDGWEALTAHSRTSAPNRLRSWCETSSQECTTAIRALRGVLWLLPHRVVRACGATAGLLFYAADRKHRRVALTNLAQSFPNRTSLELRATAREMFRHFGRLLFEMLKFSTLSPAAMLRRVEFEGEDRARLAYAQGRGVLFFTGHFGFWGLHAIVHGLQLRPIGVLARALDNPHLNTLLEDVRGRTGNTVIYRQGAVRRI